MRVLRMEIGADSLMLEPARFAVRMLASRERSVWEYRFGYSVCVRHVKAKYGSDLSGEDAQIAKQAIAYWSNFAKTEIRTGQECRTGPSISPHPTLS